jgi:hypothetical protein
MLTPLKAGRRYSIIRGVLQEGQAGSVLGHLSVGGEEDEFVAQRPQEARVVYGA